MSRIAANLADLREKIEKAARRCGRNPETIQLLAVSKTFGADRVQEARQAGQRLFGENRVQEAEKKIQAVSSGDLTWHLIGPLQSNKAGRAVELFDVIQTLDRPKIVTRVNDQAHRMGKRLRVFLEVNVGAEPQKHGVLPARLEPLAKLVDSMPALDLQGLMTIPPYHEDPEQSRPYFQRLRKLLADLNRRRVRPLAGLSMGMSHDYAVAIEEGATLLRIGTAIFGPRKAP